MREVIHNACQKFLSRDSQLVLLNVKEEAMNHRLAVYIEEYLKVSTHFSANLSIDVEYDRQGLRESKKSANGKLIRPDILVHERGNDDNNLLAIECKKRSFHSSDKRKLMELRNEKGYQFVCILKYLRGSGQTPLIKLILIDNQASFETASVVEVQSNK